MKKLISFALILCVLFGSLSAFAFTSSAADEVVDLLKSDVLTHVSGDPNASFTWDGENLVASNPEFGDCAIMSEVYLEKGQTAYVEATGVINSGVAWGIIVGEVDYEAPLATGWLCLNFCPTSADTRSYSVNSMCVWSSPYQTQYQHPTFKNAYDVPRTLGFEVDENGTFKFFVDGILYDTQENAGWEGGYLGLMTYQSVTTFTNFTVKYGTNDNYVERSDRGPQNEMTFSKTIDVLAEAMKLEHVVGAGTWTVADGMIQSRSASTGDTGVTTEIFVEPGQHVYMELKADLITSGAIGLMISEKSTNPADGWLCLNATTTWHDGRLFSVNTNAIAWDPYEIGYDGMALKAGEPITLGIEVTADSTFYLTINGVQFGERNIPGWQGGYLGLMTWQGDADFFEYTLNYVETSTATAGAVVEEPVVEEPVVEEPVVEEPVVEEPVVETPAVEEPKVEAPVVEAPKTADVAIVLAAAAILSSGAAIISKKRR